MDLSCVHRQLVGREGVPKADAWRCFFSRGQQVASHYSAKQLEGLFELEEDDYWEKKRDKKGGVKREEHTSKAKANGSAAEPFTLDDSGDDSDGDSAGETRREQGKGMVNKQKDTVLESLAIQFGHWIVRQFEHDSLLAVRPSPPLSLRARCELSIGGNDQR